MAISISSLRPNFGLTHAWFLSFNVGTLAVIICVLAGCRRPMEAKYSLITTARDDIVNFMDSNCTSCTFDNLPEKYALGLSGVCRFRGGEVECETQFPNSFNLTQAIESDMNSNENSASEGPAVVHAEPLDHALVYRLSKALSGLLIVSTIVSFALIPLSLSLELGFHKIIFFVSLGDACLLLSSGFILRAIMARQLLGVFPEDTFRNTDGLRVSREIQFLGIGTWLLLAGFISRLLSHPLLLIGFFSVCWAIIWIPFKILFGCCSDSSGGQQVVIIDRTGHQSYSDGKSTSHLESYFKFWGFLLRY